MRVPIRQDRRATSFLIRFPNVCQSAVSRNTFLLLVIIRKEGQGQPSLGEVKIDRLL
jgi:hypothetical protein